MKSAASRQSPASNCYQLGKTLEAADSWQLAAGDWKQDPPAPSRKTMFNKVLIANRGEIAVRIVRACRELGVRSVAVYSDADRASLHVRLADEARRIGPAPSSESYLRSEAILEAAQDTGAEAIHPGYGFLAENAEFARASSEAGLVFIGPPPGAMRIMGDKAEARALAERASVPVVPGTAPVTGAEGEAALAAAKDIGFPLLVKATAGGGGKGMRLVGSGGRARDGDRPGELRSRVELRQPVGIPGEVRRAPPPHRVSNRCGRARTRDPPARARVLDPKAPSEAHRRGTIAVHE